MGSIGHASRGGRIRLAESAKPGCIDIKCNVEKGCSLVKGERLEKNEGFIKARDLKKDEVLEEGEGLEKGEDTRKRGGNTERARKLKIKGYYHAIIKVQVKISQQTAGLQ